MAVDLGGSTPAVLELTGWRQDGWWWIRRAGMDGDPCNARNNELKTRSSHTP